MTDEEIAALQASVKALEEKNSQLIGEKKSATAKSKEAEALLARLDGADIDALLAGQAKLQELQDEEAKKRGDFDELVAKMKAEGDAREAKLQEQLANEQQARAGAHKQIELTKALTEAGVKPSFMEAVMALHSSSVNVEANSEGSLVASIGDKTVADFIAEWSKSDTGKEFVAAPNGSGMGAKPANGPAPGPVSEAAKVFDRKSGAWNLSQQMSLKATDPEQYATLAAQYPDHSQPPATAPAGIGFPQLPGGFVRVS